jgi:thiol-disulfide isomerase/thioredoxin
MERSGKITLVIIISFIIAVAVITFFVSQKNTQSALSSSEAGTSLTTQAGQSPYTDIDGNPVAIDENLGSVLVVSSWASWCPSCAEQLPDLALLGEEFADRDVKVLAINRAEPKTTAVAFLKSIRATEGLQLVLDPDDRFYASIDGYAMPEILFYDPQGSVVFHQRGIMTYEQLKSQTELMLAQDAN